MSRYEARSAHTAARAASDNADQIISIAARFAEIRQAIVQGRNDAEGLAAEGYRMETSHAALNASREALTATALALQSEGPAAADVHLGQAQQALASAQANGTALPGLRAANNERLSLVEQRGAAAAELISAGRRDFDMVDEFAESTWSDIRGNGSEAQAAADRAHEHWERAAELNTMEAQEFHAAAESLDAADQELTYVEQLIGAITQRLADLEQARASAKDTYAEAERSIAAGWEFVRNNDPDVSREPEEWLRQAEQQLTVAQEQFQQERPDWLVLMQAAQAADKFADDALAGARSEAETIAKLRDQVAKARQQATAEVQKVVNFVGLHGDDISAAGANQVQAVQNAVQQAYAMLQQAEQLEDTRRRAALEQTYAAYQQVQTAATAAFQTVQADVQRLEQLRSELNGELAEARAALTAAQRAGEQYRTLFRAGATATVARIEVARRRFDRIRLPIRGEAQIRKTIKEAQAIKSEALAIGSELEALVRKEQQRRASDFVTGMVVGAVTSSSRRSGGGWGGSGGWSGGGGGGGWGSGGGGGGSFGGGGGGGSFGGGGGGGGW